MLKNLLGISILIAVQLHTSLADSCVKFFDDADYKGSNCAVSFKYDMCYSMATIFNDKTSSVEFYNNDILANKFTLTIYENEMCNGKYIRWGASYTLNEDTGGRYINYVGDFMNDKMSSFRVNKVLYSNTQGVTSSRDGQITKSSCDCAYPVLMAQPGHSNKTTPITTKMVASKAQPSVDLKPYQKANSTR
jgi:hypothetical protein